MNVDRLEIVLARGRKGRLLGRDDRQLLAVGGKNAERRSAVDFDRLYVGDPLRAQLGQVGWGNARSFSIAFMLSTLVPSRTARITASQWRSYALPRLFPAAATRSRECH